MSKIDWTKAPEWATHYGPENDCYCEAWYRVVDGKIVTFAEADSANCVPQPANQGECFYHPLENLIAPWAGEGLPPVGTVCEVEPHNTYCDRDAELRSLLTAIVARYPTYDRFDVLLMERARAVLDRLKRREQ